MVNAVDKITRGRQHVRRVSHVMHRTPTIRSVCLQFHPLDSVVVPHLEALRNALVDILVLLKALTILNA